MCAETLTVDAVVYVVDSADIDRLNLSKVELAAILKVRICLRL